MVFRECADIEWIDIIEKKGWGSVNSVDIYLEFVKNIDAGPLGLEPSWLAFWKA